MEVSDLENAMNEKLQELEKFRLEYAEKLKGDFSKVIKSLFDDTGIQAIVWTQYTPYFNDGDECIFTTHDPIFILDGFDPDIEVESAYEYEDDDKYLQYEDFTGNYGKSLRKLIADKTRLSSYQQAAIDKMKLMDEKYSHIQPLFESFSKILITHRDLMKYIYGDHVQIILSKDKTEVLEYEHD